MFLLPGGTRAGFMPMLPGTSRAFVTKRRNRFSELQHTFRQALTLRLLRAAGDRLCPPAKLSAARN
jgi:hypothetical protein